MSFNCKTHGWNHLLQMCPYCFGTVTSDSAVHPFYINEIQKLKEENEKLKAALKIIADKENKCILGPTIDQADEMIQRASSNDDLMCWSFEMGSHRAFVECALEAKSVLAEMENE